ncbi:MAG: hypothetical protein QNJ46_03015 [Leptolyngbyaceae cyanobacterium MO_188.B28]|nr:hypothetical protein [Leptolyngbyaceae cyanobacterium MO_188.B28]
MASSIETQKLDDIATWMIPIQSTNLPSVLSGVFFMDGNPLPDDCLTMNNLMWDEETNSLILPVSAPVQWTFHRSVLGWLLLRGAQLSRFRYKIQFDDESLQRARIIPIIFGVPVAKWMIHASMCRAENSENGDIWLRKNLWFGGLSRVGEYVLRRVVDEAGQHTPAFQDMLSKVKLDCLVVARHS